MAVLVERFVKEVYKSEHGGKVGFAQFGVYLHDEGQEGLVYCVDLSEAFKNVLIIQESQIMFLQLLLD